MDENGSHLGVRALSKDPAHEHFVELCALSTSGTLRAEEWKELRDHLAGCAKCRKTKQEYEALITSTIPALAPDDGAADTGAVNDPLPPVSAEYALLQKLEAEAESRVAEPPTPLPIYRWSGWRWGATAALLFAFCGIGYWGGVREGKRADSGSRSAAPTSNSHIDPSRRQPTSELIPAEPVKAREDTSQLRAELRKAQSEAAELREQKAQLEQRLNQQGADLDRGAAERTELDKKLAATVNGIKRSRKMSSCSSMTAISGT